MPIEIKKIRNNKSNEVNCTLTQFKIKTLANDAKEQLHQMLEGLRIDFCNLVSFLVQILHQCSLQWLAEEACTCSCPHFLRISLCIPLVVYDMI